MATDVVGYSKLMQSDEAVALAALAAIREATQSQIKQHGGRVANTTGDSVLAEFGSAVEAVSCAMSLQEELSNHGQDAGLQLRIGVHLGDVVDKGGDLFGTAVNVAARLEGVAQPRGIIVFAAVRDAIAGKLPAYFTDLGLKALKNIEQPVRAYSITVSSSPIAGSPTLPDKPSIAVLAFENLSGDRDQEYLADGMVEKFITALSRMRWLFVIARNSSFAYKGRAVDVKQVGRELGFVTSSKAASAKQAAEFASPDSLSTPPPERICGSNRFDGATNAI
jgi:adenylate cyclase